MKRSEIRTLVIENTGRSDKATLINNSLDFGLLEISKLFQFDELRKEFDTSITYLDTQFGIPTTLDQIIEIRLLVPLTPTLSYPMELMRKISFIKDFPNVVGSTITGRPLWCYREGNQIFLDRKSNDAFIVRITGYFLAKFEDDVSENPIKASDEAITAYATASVYRSIQMYDDAKYWDNKFAILTQTLVNAKQKETGVHNIAEGWTRKNPLQVNQPWLDPFEGHQN